MSDDFQALLAEIDGVEVFAWWPVRLKCGAGHFSDGWCWLRKVKKRRYIGFPAFYYERIKEQQA